MCEAVLERTVRSSESMFFFRETLKALSEFFYVRKYTCVRRNFTEKTTVLRNENLDTGNLASDITKTCPCWENVGGFMFVCLFNWFYLFFCFY